MFSHSVEGTAYYLHQRGVPGEGAQAGPAGAGAAEGAPRARRWVPPRPPRPPPDDDDGVITSEQRKFWKYFYPDYAACLAPVEAAKAAAVDAAAAARSAYARRPPSPESEPEPDPLPDYNAEAERFRHLPGPPPSPLLVAVVTAFVVFVLWPTSVFGMRGPHHPRGEVIAHHHYRPSPEQHTKLTHDQQLLEDKEHIREDLGRWATQEAVDKMTPEELQFHYFKLHDLDENIKLDGLEILRAIMHTEDDHSHEGQDDDHAVMGGEGEGERHGPTPIDYYIELIDEVLREDDKNNDGYLSYAEYVVGRNQSKRRAAGMMEKPAPMKELPGMHAK